jgi:hypothetical protein
LKVVGAEEPGTIRMDCEKRKKKNMVSFNV